MTPEDLLEIKPPKIRERHPRPTPKSDEDQRVYWRLKQRECRLRKKGEKPMIVVCACCGGLRATEPLELYGGTPCQCPFTCPTTQATGGPQGGKAEERIRSAAVRKAGVVYPCFAHTYHELIRLNLDAPEDVMKGEDSEQGFVTTSGRFIDRFEALEIARAAGQIVHEHAPIHGLFSEDLRPITQAEGRPQITTEPDHRPASLPESVSSESLPDQMGKSQTKIEFLALSIPAHLFTVPLPTGKEIITAVNSYASSLKKIEALREALKIVSKKAPVSLEANVNAHYQVLLSGRELAAIRTALAEGEGEK